MFSPSETAHNSSVSLATLYTTLTPAFVFCMALLVPRSPHLITRSPFTYSSKEGFDQTTFEDSATLLSLVTFSWPKATMSFVIDQSRSSVDELIVPYRQARTRSFHLYHAWKQSCARSLRGELPPNPKEEALGRCPKRVNAVLWRIVQVNRSAFVVVWIFDILLACGRNLPALALKYFLSELEAVESRETTKYAWAWFVIMTLSLAARTFITAADYIRWNVLLQGRTRAAIASLVFERALLVRLYPLRPSNQFINAVAGSRHGKNNLLKVRRGMASLTPAPMSSMYTPVM